MLAGSMGMLPSASLGTRRTAHGLFGLYEPIHGSAPDIAGQEKANPIAAILTVALMLRYSFNLKEEAKVIERAVERIVEAGYRTEDLREEGTALIRPANAAAGSAAASSAQAGRKEKEVVGTKEMGRLIAEAVLG